MSNAADPRAFIEQLQRQADTWSRELEAAEPAARELLKQTLALGKMPLEALGEDLTMTRATLFCLVGLVTGTFSREQQRRRALKRNASPIDEARIAWTNRPDRRQSKTAFAMAHIAQRKLKVSVRTISESWLKGL